MIQRLKESEEKLKTQERIGAWQRMARQVAHEIKNPLTPMKLNLQMLQMLYRKDKKINKIAEALLLQIENLKNIANSFSEFSKMLSGEYFSEKNFTPINVNQLLTKIYSLYSSAKPQIEWKIHLPKEELWTKGIENELNRALINLIQNAVQAEARTIVLSLELVQSKNIIKITLEDDGEGIPISIQKNVFEPNFTTKSKGMGLGLAIVKQIITQMNGKIFFQSEEGKGTCFFIEIPRKK